MKRSHRITLLAVGALVGLCVLAVVVAHLVFTKERILAALSPRIEAAINRPVHIGEAGLSFAGGVGVWLGDVTVGNAPGFSDEPLLTLHRFDIKARFWPLLAGQVEIDRMLLVAPSLLLEYGPAGESNLTDLVVKADTTAETPSETPQGVSVDRILLTDGNVLRYDERTDETRRITGIDLDVKLARWRGSSSTDFELSLSFDSVSVESPVERTSLGEGRPSVYCLGSWDGKNSTLRLDSVGMGWFGATLSAQGVLRTHEALTEVQVNARLRPTDLHDIAREIGEAHGLAAVRELEGTVSGDCAASFVWPLPDGAVPDWRLSLDFENIKWPLPESDEEFSLPRLEVRGEDQTISWSGPAGRIADGTASLSGTVDRVFAEEPTVSARLRASFPAGSVQRVLADAVSWELSGDVHCDLSAFGPLDDWREARIAGDLSSNRLVIRDSAWPFDSVRTGFSLESDGDYVKVRRFDWQAGESSGRFTGGIDGLVARLRSGTESPDMVRARLDLRCSRLNLDELIGHEEETSEAGSETTDALYEAFRASGTIRADTAVYSGLLLSDLNCEYEFKDDVLSIDPIRGRLYGGRLRGSLEWKIANWQHPTFTTDMRADSVEADAILTRYLGWAGSVFGEMSIDGQFAGRGRSAGEILPSLAASGRADMRLGRLESAPLLSAVGTATGISGLDGPHALKNVAVPFRIAAGRIITDKMRFDVGDARFACDGSFGLDRTLDYKVKVTPLAGKKASGLLDGADLRFDLSGSVERPTIKLDAAHTAKSLIDNLLPKRDDSASRNRVTDALKNLLKPQKP